jgi:hypothetical protein
MERGRVAVMLHLSWIASIIVCSIGLSAALVCGCGDDDGGCQTDLDCREPRVCEDGECVDPGAGQGGAGSGTAGSGGEAGSGAGAGESGSGGSDAAGSGGEAGSGDSQPSLADGSYYEDPDRYSHVDVIDSGASMRVYVVSDMPDDYCEYTNRGVLADNPSTGFTVSGDWIKFRAEDTWCGMFAEYALVSQTDPSELQVRSSTESFEAAYEENTEVFVKK